MTDKKDPNQKSSPTIQEKASDQSKSTAQSQQTTKQANQQTSQPAPNKSHTNHESDKPAGKKRATAALLIALILAGSVGGLSYYQYQRNLEYSQQLQTQVSALKGQVSENLETAQASFKEELAQAKDAARKAEIKVQQQEKSIHSLQKAITDIKGRSSNDWLLAEADYLLKMAGRKLFLEHDVVSATSLLESADQRIASLNDPSLVSLRQAMAEDIRALQSLPLVDQEGLVIQLMDLQKQVDQLPLTSAIIPKALEEKATQSISEDVNDWQENLTASLKRFSDSFITIRLRDGDVKPLLSPNQHFYLQENIKAKLETAIQAVGKENNTIYQASLATAQEWSKRFFDQNSSQVQLFEKQLATLAQKNIQVDYPVELSSQKPLTNIISERLRRSITALGEEE